MKASLIFKLPEENEEFHLAQHGGDYYRVLSDLDNFLRAKLKYEQLSEQEADIYQSIRTTLYEYADEWKVEI